VNHRVELEPVSIGHRGQRYRAHYAGAVLIEGSRNPEFDACRALLARGITGTLEVWHKGATFASMRLDIEKGARLTVVDSDSIGPRITRWHPRFEDVAQNAVSRDAGSPRAAANEIQTGRPSQKD
jgi:hypothetical protein